MEKFEERDIQLSEVTEELNNRGKEITYWTLTTRMKDSKNMAKNMIDKIKRKMLLIHI